MIQSCDAQVNTLVSVWSLNHLLLAKMVILASMLVGRVCLLLLAKIYNFWQVCSFVGVSVCLSVSLSVLSSITHERFDISSPNLVHIWNG